MAEDLPKIFPVEEQSEVVNFTNIDKEDYEGMWNGRTKVIRAGETIQLAKFLALHYAKHLVNKIIMRESGGQADWNDVSIRKPFLDRILGEPPAPVQTPVPVIPQEQPVAQEIIPAQTEEFAELKEKTEPIVTGDVPPMIGVPKVFVCDVCGKEFKAKIGMLGHRRSHAK